MRRVRIPMDKLELGASLGHGAFGEVFAATYRGTPVAVKTMHAHRMGKVDRAIAFRDEVRCALPLALCTMAAFASRPRPFLATLRTQPPL